MRTALHELRQRLPTVVGFQILAAILASLVLLPLGSWVLSSLVASTGTPAISNFDLATFFLSPTGLLALLVTASVMVAVVLLEQTGFLLVARTPTRDRFPAISVLLRASRHLPFLLRLAAVQLVAAGIAAIPFALGGWAVFSAFLTDHDINYYLALRPTEFWVAGAAVAVLAAGYGLLLAALYIRWILAVPVYLFDGGTVRSALGASWRSTKGNVWRIARGLGCWWLAVLAISAIGALLFRAVEGGLLGLLGSSVGVAIATVGGLLALEVIIGVVVGFAASAVHFLLLVQAHEGLRGAIAVQEEPRTTKAPALGKLVWAAAGVLVVLTVGICFSILDRLEDDPRVLVTAHRGSSFAAPENSLAAIRQAIDDGADYAEIDVQETADGVIVVVHDSDLKRITGVARNIWDVSYEEIRELDAGSWFGPEFAGERIPTLQQAIEVARGKIKLNIELKFNGHDQRLAERVVEIVEREEFANECVIMSLDHAGMRVVRELNPELEIGALVAQSVGDVTALDVDFIAFATSQVNRDRVGRVQRAGKKVHVWTVNELSHMLQFVNLGVDSIITDVPDRLVELLTEIDELTTVERLFLAFRYRIEW